MLRHAPRRRAARASFLALLVVLLVAACDDDGNGGGATDDAADSTAPDTVEPDTAEPDTAEPDTATPDTDTTPSDTTAPELRDVRVTLPGARGPITLDLNAADVERVLPRAAVVEVTVFARDDVSAADALVVSALDASGMPLEPLAEPSLRNGLWSFEVAIAPGDTLRVAVADAAGNVAESAYVLRLVPHEDALVATWLQREYDTSQAVTGSTTLALAADATFTLDTEAGSATGTWLLDGDDLVLELRTNTFPDVADSDPTTLETDWRSSFYVDETHFSPRVWQRTSGEDGGAAGTWTRSVTERVYADGAPTPSRDETATLELAGDGTFTLAVEGTHPRTESGTWEIVVSDNYEETAGDFLSRTTTTRDGAPVDPPETTFDLVKATPAFLLIDAALRAE